MGHLLNQVGKGFINPNNPQNILIRCLSFIRCLLVGRKFYKVFWPCGHAASLWLKTGRKYFTLKEPLPLPPTVLKPKRGCSTILETSCKPNLNLSCYIRNRFEKNLNHLIKKIFQNNDLFLSA